jgi:gas vesicle protein
MKAASVHEIKQALLSNSSKELAELCLRLAKFKKENKELLTYLLFEAHNEEAYIAEVNQQISEEFDEIDPGQNLYFVKKTLRKILRIASKHIRYTGSKQAEVAILLHYSLTLKKSGIPFMKSTALANLYKKQIKKIHAAISTLHEDLQYDYLQMMNEC